MSNIRLKVSRCLIRNPQSTIRNGFTLIELMAVVAIITILASIMVTNVAKNIERGKVGKATADIDVLVKAISLFQIDNGILPNSLEDLFKTEGKYGRYISDPSLSATPWGTPYEYTHGDDYYKIQAMDTKGKIRAEKIINF